jgi:adenylate cyclase
MAERIRNEVPECEAAIGVAAGEAVAGNVGANERFEYTVIGEPVNEASRLCDLAKERPSRLLASSVTVANASEKERARWSLADTVSLRGLDQPTQLAVPV